MKNRKKLVRMTATALLMALVFLLGMTPLGLIPLGFINVTILCVPVIIGAILLDRAGGLLLGISFGTVSFLALLGMTMTTPSTLATALLQASPVSAAIMCYAPRLLVPLASKLVYNKLSKRKTGNKAALPFAAAAGSVTNTVFYLGLMLLFYYMNGLDSKAILSLIAGVGLIAGSCEAIAAALLVTPIVAAVRKTHIGKMLNTEAAK